VSKENLRKKIEKLKKYNERHKALKKQLDESSQNEISLTDPDSRRMRTSSGLDVCYNLQTAVDGKHKLIVVHEVSNAPVDQGKLYDMAARAKEALAAEELTVVADGAYFSQSDMKRCEEENITTYVPVPADGNPKDSRRFSRDVFEYDHQRDVYICPQGEELKLTSVSERNNKLINYYQTSACAGCPIRKQCTTSKNGRRIKRWVDEAVTDRLKQRLRDKPEMMAKRKTLVEHPYGTIKRAMNQGYFLLKGLAKVAIEIDLTVLAYNMKRAIGILGVARMIGSLEMEKAD
jgi:macrodomain Ter protein organizer (MatP/YcbG family)